MVAVFARGLVFALLFTFVVGVRSAEADAPVSDYVVVPQSGHDASLWLPGHSVLLLASRAEDVVVYDVQSAGVTTVPGTIGVVSLSASQDENLVYGAVEATDELVEIDLTTMQVRRWEVAGNGCPRSAVGRGGFVYFVADRFPRGVNGCTTARRLARLDMASGDVTLVTGPSIHDYRVDSVNAVRGAPRFVAWGSGQATTFELNGSGEVAQAKSCDAGSAAGSILTEEGTQGASFSAGSTWFFDLGSCAYLGSVVNPPGVSVTTQASDQDVVALGVDGVYLIDRATQTITQSYLLDGWGLEPVDARLLDTDLYVIAIVGSEKRLYRLTEATVPRPDLTFELPERIGVGMPIRVGGVLTDGGQPVPNARIELHEIFPASRTVAEATTGPDGTWSAEFVEQDPALLRLEARTSHRGLAVVERDYMSVLTDFYEVHLAEAPPVAPASEFSVRGTLTRNGAAAARVPVAVSRLCLAPWNTGSLDLPATTNRTGEFEVTNTAGPCNQYEFDAVYRVDDGHIEEDSVLITVLRERTLLMAHDTHAIAGEPVELTATLTGLDGRPVEGQQVSLRMGDDMESRTLTTGDDGVARYTETFSTTGRYYFSWSFDGTDSLSNDSFYNQSVFVTKRETDVSLTGPDSALIDEPYTLSGTFVGGPLPAQLTLKPLGGPALPITTDETGAWSQSVTSAVAGPRSWQITYSASTSYSASVDTHVVSVSKLPTSLEVTGSTSTLVGDPVHFTGGLTGVAAEVELVIERPDGSTQIVRTAADGTFTFSGTATAAGESVWVVRFAGTDRHLSSEAATTVRATTRTPAVSLHTDRTQYSAGQLARIAVNVSGSATRVVTVTATRSGRAPQVIFAGALPESGLVLSRTMLHSETLTVTHAQDVGHASASARVFRGVRLGLATTALRPASRVGTYAIFRPAADPTFLTATKPSRPGACVRMLLQRNYSGVWRTVRTSTCRTVLTDGKTRWTLTGNQPLRVSYRVRAQFGGDALNAAANGPWTYFRFRP